MAYPVRSLRKEARLHVLIVTLSFPDPSRGVFDGRFVLSEATAYAKNGAAVLVITPHFPNACRYEVIEPGIRVHRFRYFLPERWQTLKVPGKPMYRLTSPVAILQIPMLLFALTFSVFKHARNADVIHAQWTLTALLSLPAKWFFRTKLVVTARGSDIRLLPRWLNRFVHRQVDAAIDCFHALPWSNWYKSNFPGRFLKLPLIVDPGGKLKINPQLHDAAKGPTKPLIILYIGRFDRTKLEQNRLPIFDLIAAAVHLKRAGKHLHVFYLGEGEPNIKQRMLDTIEAEGASEYITMLPPNLEVGPFVRACHLGVGGICTNGVSQDFTINRKPQILMDTPDNRDTPWRDRVNALVVPPEDTAALIHTLSWASDHRSELALIGERAMSDLRNYLTDPENGGRLYLSAFRLLLAEG
jgi:glycosyltransferase involved in cell wall biosynthesis